MKAYLLARVSTDDQKDALPAQTHRLIEYAKRRGYQYELSELRESAYKGNRDDFRVVVERIRGSKDDAIVVFDKIDRYTRDSSSEEVRILQALYRTGKIELHFPSDNLFIHKDSPATDLLRLGMGIVVAQYYSDAISDNVRRRFEQKLRDGEWIGMAPFGYKNVISSNGKKWIEIDDYKASAVRFVFEQYATGVQSQRLLCQALRDKFSIKVGCSQMDLILRNPFYYGEMRVKGVLYKHNYDTIITRDLFDQVDAVKNGYKMDGHRWGGLPFTYRGLIQCSDCGCKITFEKKKGKYIYGHCTKFKGKHPMKYVSEDKLTSQLAEVFKSIQIPEDAYRQVSEALRASHEDKKRLRESKISSLDAEIEKYQRRIEKVYEDYLDEKIPESLYQKKFDEYKVAQHSLQSKRLNIEQVENDYYGTVSHLLRLAKNAPNLFKVAGMEQKRSMIKMVLSNLDLDGDQLRYKYKKPFEMMAFCNKSSTWLRRLGSNQ